MKLNAFINKPVTREMPLGKGSFTFKEIAYREDKEGEVIGAWVRSEEYRDLYIPISDENTYQLDLLTAQLGVESYDPEVINTAAGKKVEVYRYTRGEYTNTSYNPNYRETVEEYA